MKLRALPIVSLCFLILGGAYLVKSIELPMGSAARPGAGFYPLLVAITMVSLSLVLLSQALKPKTAQQENEEPFPQGKDRQRVMAVAMALIFFVILLRPLGYAIGSAALMGAVLRILGLRSWRKIFLISILTAAVSYWLFSFVLGVPLPRGLLFF